LKVNLLHVAVFNNYSPDNLIFSGVHDSRKSANSKIQSSEAEDGEANSNWSEAENGVAKAIHTKRFFALLWMTGRQCNSQLFSSKSVSSEI